MPVIIRSQVQEIDNGEELELTVRPQDRAQRVVSYNQESSLPELRLERDVPVSGDVPISNIEVQVPAPPQSLPQHQMEIPKIREMITQLSENQSSILAIFQSLTESNSGRNLNFLHCKLKYLLIKRINQSIFIKDRRKTMFRRSFPYGLPPRTLRSTRNEEYVYFNEENDNMDLDKSSERMECIHNEMKHINNEENEEEENEDNENEIDEDKSSEDEDKIYYSAEYSHSSNCADSSYVKFFWNGQTIFGQINYFLEIQFNGYLNYNFAYISPLTWNGNIKIHKVVDINRLVTDKVESEMKLLVKLEDLIDIIGLFHLKRKVMNIEAYAIVSFSL